MHVQYTRFNSPVALKIVNVSFSQCRNSKHTNKLVSISFEEIFSLLVIKDIYYNIQKLLMHYTAINCFSDKYLLSRRSILGYKKDTENNKVLTYFFMTNSTVQMT